MSRSPATVIAGKSDQASRSSCECVMDDIREAYGSIEIIDYSAGPGQARKVGDVHTLMGLLSRGKADIAVVEAGELPLRFGRNIEIGAVQQRGNPFNVFVSDGGKILDDITTGAAVSIGDPGLRGQLLSYRDDIDFLLLEEAYESLLGMLSNGEIAGFVARAWEVEMLGRQDEVAEVFTSSICMPPAGQGAVALMIRSGDRKAAEIVGPLGHQPSLEEIILERTLQAALSKDGIGGMGVLAEFEGDEFELGAAIAAPDGSSKLTSTMRGWKGDELNVVGSMVEDLIERGGLEIMEMYKKNPKMKA